MNEPADRPDSAAAVCAEFVDRFGEIALDLCAAIGARLDGDQDLAARVAHRHALLAEEYAALGGAASLATAQAAGRRAWLVVLLLEGGDRFFAA